MTSRSSMAAAPWLGVEWSGLPDAGALQTWDSPTSASTRSSTLAGHAVPTKAAPAGACDLAAARLGSGATMPRRLRRVSPNSPGWSRRRHGRGFVYIDESGKRLDAADAARCKALVIPPAWLDVWICPLPNGHLQAVGTDAAGRRQYLYHPDWREQRDRAKHDRVLEVARRLPGARARVRKYLAQPGMPRERALATAFRLLDLGLFRIGGEAYAAENGSYGLATIEKRHVRIVGDSIAFTYRSKSGQDQRVIVTDKLACATRSRCSSTARRGVATARLSQSSSLARRDVPRHQSVHQGGGRRRRLGQGLPDMARHCGGGGVTGGDGRRGDKCVGAPKRFASRR